MKELTVGADVPGERLFLLGNEAIARGAIEAGVRSLTSVQTHYTKLIGDKSRQEGGNLRKGYQQGDADYQRPQEGEYATEDVL